MIIVAAGRGFDGFEALAAVGGAIRRRVHHVDDVWVARIRGDAAEIPAALPPATIRRRAAPILARIVGAIYAAVMRVHHGINAIAVLSRRDGDADAAETFAGKSVASNLIPSDAGIRGFVQAAAGSIGGRVNIPGRAAG